MSGTEPNYRPRDSPPYTTGDVIDGKYRVDGILGDGSFGWVYMASHTRVGALQYAVKVLKAEHTTDPETVARFQREAETVASLRSRHSVRVTDYGVAPEGLPYMVMEFVNGLSVGEMLRRGGPFPEDDVLELSLHTLRALDEAHKLGIIHRDLKPDNVLVVDDPDSSTPIARVLDFGLAKILEPESFETRPEETAAGLVLCTARYASPDLLRGSPSAASDIYALGISMIEMLDGTPPYAGDDFYTVAAKHIEPVPVPLGEASSSSFLKPVIQRATEKEVRKRYASAAEMITDLESLVQMRRAALAGGFHDTVSASMRARFTLPSQRVIDTARRRKAARIALLVLLAVTVILGAAFMLTRGGDAPPAADRPNENPPLAAPPGADPVAPPAATPDANAPEPVEANGSDPAAVGTAGAGSGDGSGSAPPLARADGPAAEPDESVAAGEHADADVAAERDARRAEAEREARARARRERREREEAEERRRALERVEGDTSGSTSEGDSDTEEGNLFDGIRTMGGP